jgi:hypothetical protein|tara:strand:+ start:5567 stop:5782 length:216 start_codon:yes stop_codon:yes gene_type:complete
MTTNIEWMINHKTEINTILMHIQVLEFEIEKMESDLSPQNKAAMRNGLVYLKDRVEDLKDDLYKLKMGDIL